MADWVQEWVDDRGGNEGGGIEQLRIALHNGFWEAGKRPDVVEYLAQHKQASEDLRNERVAIATESQAKSAERSLKRSTWAIWISILAIVLTAFDLWTKKH